MSFLCLLSRQNSGKFFVFFFNGQYLKNDESWSGNIKRSFQCHFHSVTVPSEQ